MIKVKCDGNDFYIFNALYNNYKSNIEIIFFQNN